MEGAKRGFARGRVWPRRLLDARRYPLSRYRRGGASSETRFTKRTAALGSIDFPVSYGRRRHFIVARKQSAIFFRRWSARRFRRGGGFGAATVRPRTRLSRRGLRAFTERDGQESQRKTPPGCVSPPFVAEPRPRLDAPAPFPRNRRRRRRLRRESADDARASRAKTPTTRSSSRAAAVPRRRVAAGTSSRAYQPSTVSIPRLSAPPPARHGRTPRRCSPTAALRRSCPIRHRQVLLPGEGAGLPLARVVQARAAEPQV